jgi:hypothetical protein
MLLFHFSNRYSRDFILSSVAAGRFCLIEFGPPFHSTAHKANRWNVRKEFSLGINRFWLAILLMGENRRRRDFAK